MQAVLCLRKASMCCYEPLPKRQRPCLRHGFSLLARALRKILFASSPMRWRSRNASHGSGHLSRDDMERAFEAAWVQAVPSQWDEPFGNVTTEAMMRGSAVVVSDGGAQPEIVGPVGRVVPRADVNAWATALVEVLRDRETAERRGAEGRVRAQTEFSDARCLDRFEALYARLTTLEPTLVSD